MKNTEQTAKDLLEEDGWEFVRTDGELQLWKKFNFFVWFCPLKGFSPISIDVEPPKTH
jgi:hypothetical protein